MYVYIFIHQYLSRTETFRKRWGSFPAQSPLWNSLCWQSCLQGGILPGTSTGSGVQSERASSRAELAVRGLCKDSAPSAGQPEGRPLRRKSPVGAEEKKAAKKDALFFREHPFLFLYSSIAPVPARMSAKPTPALRLSFSFSTRPENTMVTKMLSLSMGTTTLANPSWRAR